MDDRILIGADAADQNSLDRARKLRTLIKLMKQQCLLSEGEAIAAIADYRAGSEFSSEAVNHYGGTGRCIRDAVRSRHTWFMVWQVKQESMWRYSVPHLGLAVR